MVTLNALIEKLPENRQDPFLKLRNSILNSLDITIIENININAIDLSQWGSFQF